MRIVALGVMILLPFGIACVVFGALRRTGRLSTGRLSTGRATTGRDPSGRAASAADSERAGGMRELRP